MPPKVVQIFLQAGDVQLWVLLEDTIPRFMDHLL
jgi:hypothetical protein